MEKEEFTDDTLHDFVRGATSADMSDRIEAQMRANPDLSTDVALMRRLRSALQSEPVQVPHPEFGWQRLKAALEADATGQRLAMPRVSFPGWRVAAALLGAVVLAQGVYIATNRGAIDASLYRTASDVAEGNILGVAFHPDAPAGEILELLSASGANVVGGPSALGLYRLSFASKSGFQSAIKLLQASPLVALVAEEASP